MYVLILLHVSLDKLLYQETHFHGGPPRHKTKLIFEDDY
jgi:hypothetical protein